MTWLASIIRSLMANKFFGSLTIKFNAGRIVLVTKEEDLKPPAE